MSLTRIGRLFERLRAADRRALIAYITAGDPSPDRTPALVAALERGGADLIELGVPFSDPIADGPVIQRGSERALRAGTHVCYRSRNRVANPQALGDSAAVVHLPEPSAALRPGAAGARCRRVRDRWLPAHRPERRRGRRLHRPPCADAGLDTVFLAAPTSSERRLRLVARIFERLRVSGFAYRRNRRARSRFPILSPRLSKRCAPSPHCLSRSGSEFRTRIRCAPWASIADGVAVGSAIRPHRRADTARVPS